ncbi:MAG TPA: C4-type zinc ribbon domain-containing protein [Acidimicrobiales bacterium]|nr:C4-type zinc ribbon domain-containing protein [Acidimicrobiales bacterium]
MGHLQDLLAVQDLDLELDQIRHRRAHLPERAELTDLEARRGALAGELSEIESARADLTARQEQAEAELAAAESRSATVSQRMYGGTVSASRDLQAMAAELEQLKARASSLEDVVLEVLDAAEPLDARAAALAEARRSVEDQQAAAVQRLAASEQELDAELASRVGARDAAVTAVPAPLLATYERLRARLGGVGVARLVGNHCDGCHLTLSAMELDRVRHLPEGEVYTCEQCSRILVP